MEIGVRRDVARPALRLALLGLARFGLDINGWSEPLASACGVHRVRMHERATAIRPDLETVREPVGLDWIEARREADAARALETLRIRHGVAPR